MKIQTTEEVRRFNAQVELADAALWPIPDRDLDPMGPQRLHLQLLTAGHADLAIELRKAGEAIGYCWQEPDADTGQPPQIPPASMTTKGCDHNEMTPNTGPDSDRYAWKCAFCGYVYGKPEAKTLLEEIEGSMARRGTADWDGSDEVQSLLDRAYKEIRNLTNWHEFCKNSARPGDVANVMLERDHMRNVIERLLNAYAWGRKSQQVENLHAAVRSAMESIGEL